MTDIHTVNAVVSAMTVTFACECGSDVTYDIDLETEEIGPGWTAPMDERFILCDCCESVIDAGLVFSISPPAPAGDAT